MNNGTVAEADTVSTTPFYVNERSQKMQEILVMRKEIDHLYNVADSYENQLARILQEDFDGAFIEVDTDNLCYTVTFNIRELEVKLMVIFNTSGVVLFVHDISNKIYDSESFDTDLCDWLPILPNGSILYKGKVRPQNSLDTSRLLSSYTDPVFSYVVPKIKKLEIPVAPIIEMYREIRRLEKLLLEKREKFGDMEAALSRWTGVVPVMNPSIISNVVQKLAPRNRTLLVEPLCSQLQEALITEMGFFKDYLKGVLRQNFEIISVVFSPKSLFYAPTFKVNESIVRLMIVFNKSNEMLFIHDISNELDSDVHSWVVQRNGTVIFKQRKNPLYSFNIKTGEAQGENQPYLRFVAERLKNFDIPFTRLIQLDNLFVKLHQVLQKRRQDAQSLVSTD
jgi:hypothetical protein